MKAHTLLKLISVVALVFTALISQADITHVVKNGESIGGIAYKYNISVKELVDKNPQAKQGVRSGMVLQIPDNSSSSYKHPAGEEKTETAPEETSIPLQDLKETQVEEKEKEEKDVVNSYKSKAGDTLESISKLFGLSVDNLIELNPFIDAINIMEGTMIRLNEEAPYFDIPIVEIESSDENPITESDRLSLNIVPAYGSNPIMEEGAFVPSMARTKMLVLLPFMTDYEKPSKHAQQYAEFYRGMLLAANEIKGNGMMEVEIDTWDIAGNPAVLKSKLMQNADESVAVVIAPEDDAQLQTIIDFASEKGIYVANLFNVKNDNYKTNPYVLQAYINQQLMYEKAIDALFEEYPDFVPVILNPEEGKTEKDPFLRSLRNYCKQNDIEVIDLMFGNVLKEENISENAMIKPDGKYVFIPRSGSQSVFNKFAPALINYKNSSENAAEIAVYGYPDWTAFRGESLAALENLQATVYTRFYYDEMSANAKQLQHEFVEWYGNSMIETIPNQAVLGYDTANCLIYWMQTSNGQLGERLEQSPVYKGLQSTFNFRHVDGSKGYVNVSLYIVRFMPGNVRIEKLI